MGTEAAHNWGLDGQHMVSLSRCVAVGCNDGRASETGSRTDAGGVGCYVEDWSKGREPAEPVSAYKS
jgi:hypothetical protein